jgi:hypothetical protein
MLAIETSSVRLPSINVDAAWRCGKAGVLRSVAEQRLQEQGEHRERNCTLPPR